MIYLDANATTEPSENVKRAMRDAPWGNPNTINSLGLKAKQAIQEVEALLKKRIHAPENSRVIWTGSGSEANRIAFKSFDTAGTWIQNKTRLPQILISSVSHKSAIKAAYDTKCGVNQRYPINQEQIDYIEEIEPILISEILVNNETGELNNTKDLKLSNRFLHLDAVQALDKIYLDVDQLQADLMTFSGHKIYGPKGVGCLWISERAFEFLGKHIPFLGTPNVAGIIGFGAALKEKNESSYYRDTETFKKALLSHEVPGLRFNSPEHQAPGTLSIMTGVDAFELMGALEQKGVIVSMGSACNAGSMKPSYVLRLFGLSEDEIMKTIRVSIPRDLYSITLIKAADIIAETIKERLR